LYNSTDGIPVPGTEITINVADLPAAVAALNNGGWINFSFAGTPVTLEATHDYKVEAKTSDAAQVSLWRDTTAGNMSRMLITTTNSAAPPAAGSIFHIMGGHTGAGARTDFTVTMNAIAAAILDYGSGTDDTACITVSQGGTFNYGYAATTAYYLRLSGNLIVYADGTFTQGTVANPIPRDSTALLMFDPTSDGGKGLIVRDGGTFTAQGLSRTINKNIVSTKLDTDEAVDQTELGVVDNTGWLDNDKIAIASTSRTAAECETGLLNGNAAADHLDVDGFAGAGGGIAYAHSGTSPTQAEVILLTRNVKISSITSTIMTFCTFKATAIVDVDWVEFCYLGQYVADKYGITVQTTTGSCSIMYSSLWNFEDGGIAANSSTVNYDNITISYNTAYNLNSAYTDAWGIGAGTALSTANIVISYNILMVVPATGFYIGSYVTTNYNTAIGGTTATTTGIFYLPALALLGETIGNVAHSTNAYGMYANGQLRGTITSPIVWRCNGYGMFFPYSADLIIDTPILFGNTTANILLGAVSKFVLLSPTLSADTTFATTYGLAINASSQGEIYDADFSPVAGITAQHSYDIRISANTFANIYCDNCKFNASIKDIDIDITSRASSIIKSSCHNQTPGLHKTIKREGEITMDSVADMFRTATPSQRLTPVSASNKLISGSFKVNVNSGQTCTPLVWVRESIADDGTDYNGARVRIILKKNKSIGIVADVVLDTATVASEGAFEQIGAITDEATADGVMEFVVDCDGTTGWINVDDFSATLS
jgi:hypothetical protein